MDIASFPLCFSLEPVDNIEFSSVTENLEDQDLYFVSNPDHKRGWTREKSSYVWKNSREFYPIRDREEKKHGDNATFANDGSHQVSPISNVCFSLLMGRLFLRNQCKWLQTSSQRPCNP